MKITEDEVFGPVLTVYPYRDLTEAISYIAGHPHPLTMYWCGDDNDNFARLADNTRSGSINGNDFALHMFGAELPFGGIGRSGMGSYHARPASRPSVMHAPWRSRRCRSPLPR